MSQPGLSALMKYRKDRDIIMKALQEEGEVTKGLTGSLPEGSPWGSEAE